MMSKSVAAEVYATDRVAGGSTSSCLVSSSCDAQAARELVVDLLAVVHRHEPGAADDLLASFRKSLLAFQLRSSVTVSRRSLAAGVYGGAKWGAEKTPICSS